MFKKSTNPKKKYMVTTPEGKLIHWGSASHQHYRDRTPLKLYSHLDHNDKQRRMFYHNRHKAIKTKDGKPAWKNPEQPAYYSMKYLW